MKTKSILQLNDELALRSRNKLARLRMTMRFRAITD